MLRSFGKDNFTLMDDLQEHPHILGGYEKRILFQVQIYFIRTMLPQHKITHGILTMFSHVDGHSKDAGKELID